MKLVTDPAILAEFNLGAAPARSGGSDLYSAVEWVESRGNPNAIGPANWTGELAVGSMQTMPSTLRDPGYGVRPAADPSDAREQARVGRDYLDAMMRKYQGNRRLALAAYNWGPGNVDDMLARGGRLPAEVDQYANDVMARLGSPTETPERGPADGMKIVTDPEILAEFGIGTDAAAPEESGAVWRSLMGTIKVQHPKSLADFVEGMSYQVGEHQADLQGASDWIRTMVDEASADYRKEPSIEGVANLDDALTFAGETLGSFIGQYAPTIGAAIAGSAVGSRVGAIGAGAGAAIGAGATSYALNFADLYSSLKEEGVAPKSASDLATRWTLPIAGLDVLPPLSLLSKFSGPARREVARTLAKRIIQEGAKTGLFEVSTEAAQQGIQQYVVAEAKGRELGPDDWQKIIDAAIAATPAALLGGAAGLRPDRVNVPVTQGQPGTPAAAPGTAVPPPQGAPFDPRTGAPATPTPLDEEEDGEPPGPPAHQIGPAPAPPPAPGPIVPPVAAPVAPAPIGGGGAAAVPGPAVPPGPISAGPQSPAAPPTAPATPAAPVPPEPIIPAARPEPSAPVGAAPVAPVTQPAAPTSSVAPEPPDYFKTMATDAAAYSATRGPPTSADYRAARRSFLRAAQGMAADPAGEDAQAYDAGLRWLAENGAPIGAAPEAHVQTVAPAPTGAPAPQPEPAIPVVPAEPPPAPIETIAAAAVRVGGKIYTAQTHSEAYDAALREHGGKDRGSTSADRNLFVTTTGRVVSFDEARQISRPDHPWPAPIETPTAPAPESQPEPVDTFDDLQGGPEGTIEDRSDLVEGADDLDNILAGAVAAPVAAPEPAAEGPLAAPKTRQQLRRERKKERKLRVRGIPAKRPNRPLDVIEELAWSGGLAYDADLWQALGHKNFLVPGAGPIIRRKGGRDLDYARELVSQLGYLGPKDATTTINDILAAIDETARARGGVKTQKRRFATFGDAPEEQGPTDDDILAENHRQAREAIEKAVDEFHYEDVTEAHKEAATQHALAGLTPMEALDRAITDEILSARTADDAAAAAGRGARGAASVQKPEAEPGEEIPFPDHGQEPAPQRQPAREGRGVADETAEPGEAPGAAGRHGREAGRPGPAGPAAVRPERGEAGDEPVDIPGDRELAADEPGPPADDAPDVEGYDDLDDILGRLEQERPDFTYNPERKPVTTDYPVVATGDVVAGDTIRFEEGVFGGSFRNPSFLGNRTVEAEVMRDSYGADKQQHTFTLRILASSGIEPLEVGKVTRRKGRNVYRNGVWRQRWADEAARKAAADEKHGRGDAARAAREERRGTFGDLKQEGAPFQPKKPPSTTELLARGILAGMPKDVIVDQIKDVGAIASAHEKDAGLFILASNPGTGKTFVLGGAIREMRRRGQKAFHYVTVNRRLIRQIRRDLADFDLAGVNFLTYNDLATKGPLEIGKDAVLILDESHYAKNAKRPTGAAVAHMMRTAKFTIAASATPYENPVEAEYLAATGLFEKHDTTFRDWALAHGAVAKGKTKATLVWGGSKAKAMEARNWLYQRGVFSYHGIRLPPGLVTSSFVEVPVADSWAKMYAHVSSAFDAALEVAESFDQSFRIKAYRTHLLKRILESSKMDSAVHFAKGAINDGKRVILFVETKADRKMWLFPKRNQPKSDPRRYDYTYIKQAMADWRQERLAAIKMGDAVPSPPFDEAIEHIARAFDENGVKYQLPSVKEYLADQIGHKHVALYTGDESDTQAEANLDDWRAKKKLVLIATMAKGGTGLSLHDTVGDSPTSQIGLNLPWKATGVDQVSGRAARYGMKSPLDIQWLFAPNIPFERMLAPRVGGRMQAMGATVKGVDLKDAQALIDFDFTMDDPNPRGEPEGVPDIAAEQQDVFGLPHLPTKAHVRLDDDFRAWRALMPQASAAEAARVWLLDRQMATGWEHTVLLSPDGRLLAAYTSQRPNSVSTGDELVRHILDNGVVAELHHNHPSPSGLSAPDIGILGITNITTIWAHTADGHVYGAKLGPLLKNYVAPGGPVQFSAQVKMLANTARDFLRRAGGPLHQAVLSGKIDMEQAGRILADAMASVLHQAGVIESVSTGGLELSAWNVDLSSDINHLVKELVAASKSFGQGTQQYAEPKHADHRSALGFLESGGVGSFLEGRQESGPGRRGGERRLEAGAQGVPRSEGTAPQDDLLGGQGAETAGDKARRTRQEQRLEAELRGRGRQVPRKPQESFTDTPLGAGGKAVQGTLFQPESFRPYRNVPDQLMGFRATGPNLAFDEATYSFTQWVRLTFKDGTAQVDAIKGLNAPHALERAYRNWPSAARIEALPQGDYSMTLEQQAAPFGDEQNLKRIRERLGEPHKDLKERFSDFIASDFKDRLAEGTVDDLQGLKVLERAATRAERVSTPTGLYDDPRTSYKLARVSRAINDILYDAMFIGPPIWREGTVQVDESVRPPMQTIDALGDSVGDFEIYAWARRARELMEPTAQHPEGRLAFTDIPRAELEADIAAGLRLGERNAQLQTAFTELRTYWDRILDFAEMSGLLDAKLRATFDQLHRDYVPFHRILEKVPQRNLGKARMGFAGQHPNFWRFKGGQQNIERPLIAMERNIHRLIESSINNVVFLRAAQQNHVTGNAFMTPLPAKAVQVLVTNKQIIRDLESQGLEVAPQDDVDMNTLRLLWAIGNTPKGADIITGVRGGKIIAMRVHEPMLYRAMTMLSRMPNPLWIKALAIPKRILTAAVGLDPTFQARNFARDTVHSAVVSHIGFVPVLDSLRGLVNLTEKNADYRSFRQAGAGMSSVFEAGRDMESILKRRLGKKGLTAKLISSPNDLLTLLEHIESKLEYSSRMGTFMRLRAQGKPLIEAAYQARDNQTDFSMRGSWAFVRFLAEVVPFFNAGLQGLYRTGRGFGENRMAFLLKGSLYTAAALLNWSLWKDDERWKELTDEQKDSYLHFWVDDVHYKIPAPFEVGAIFGSVPVRAAEFMRDRDGEQFAQRISWIVQNMFRLDPKPQALRPIMAVYYNWDTFREAPVVPYWLDANVMAEEKFDERTPLVAVQAGRATGTAPKKLQHLIEGYFGAMGTYAMVASDYVLRTIGDFPDAPEPLFSEYPVVRGFMGPKTPYTTLYMKQFYEMKDRSERLYGSFKQLIAAGETERAKRLIQENAGAFAIRKAVNRMSDHISEINRIMAMITQDRKLTGEQKRERLEKLRASRNKLMASFAKLKGVGE